ncbi:MAG: alpha/beta hydrolase [Elsteraceae bacterium]
MTVDTPTPSLDIHPDMRALSEAGASRQPYPDGMTVRDARIARTGQGAEPDLSARFYRPRNAPSPSPCVVYLHGGDFNEGGLDCDDNVAWGVADQVGAVVMSVDYRLAKERPFPGGLEDCFAAVRYLAAQGLEQGVDPSRIAVWGDGAGGNLAAAVCLMARDQGGPKIAALALHYPWLTDELTADAYARYDGAPGLRTAAIDAAWSRYLGAERPTHNGYAAPLKAKSFARLPPTHVHYAEYDRMADDARRFASQIKRAGGVVAVRCAERMVHGFLRARFGGPDAEAEFAASCAFLKIHLAL